MVRASLHSVKTRKKLTTLCSFPSYIQTVSVVFSPLGPVDSRTPPETATDVDKITGLPNFDLRFQFWIFLYVYK